jgi:hypothetical protein
MRAHQLERVLVRDDRGTSPSVVRSGKPVTNQVTTAPADTRPRQCQPDSATVLICIDATQRDPLKRNERPW